MHFSQEVLFDPIFAKKVIQKNIREGSILSLQRLIGLMSISILEVQYVNLVILLCILICK